MTWRVFDPITAGWVTGCPFGVVLAKHTEVGMDGEGADVASCYE